MKSVKFLREQIELIKRENEDLMYEGYTLRKNQKPLKTQLENKTKDFKKWQEHYRKAKDIFEHVAKEYTSMVADIIQKGMWFGSMEGTDMMLVDKD